MTRAIARFLRHNTIALLALFLALGGTSLAAASYVSGKQIKPHTMARNRLTNKAIKQLKGNRGLPGERGPTGPQGPGAVRVYATGGQASQTAAKFGPWTLILGCSFGAPNAKLTLLGPGSVGGTTSMAGGGNPPTRMSETWDPSARGRRSLPSTRALSSARRSTCKWARPCTS
jgi:hypothetical protein